MRTVKNMDQKKYWEIMLYQDLFMDFKTDFPSHTEAHELAMGFLAESVLQIYSDEFAVLSHDEVGTTVYHAKNGKIVYKDGIADEIMEDK